MLSCRLDLPLVFTTSLYRPWYFKRDAKDRAEHLPISSVNLIRACATAYVNQGLCAYR